MAPSFSRSLSAGRRHRCRITLEHLLEHQSKPAADTCTHETAHHDLQVITPVGQQQQVSCCQGKPAAWACHQSISQDPQCIISSLLNCRLSQGIGCCCSCKPYTTTISIQQHMTAGSSCRQGEICFRVQNFIAQSKAHESCQSTSMQSVTKALSRQGRIVPLPEMWRVCHRTTFLFQELYMRVSQLRLLLHIGIPGY